MSKKRHKKRQAAYFPNYCKEVAATPWKKFPSVSYVEFTEHRVWKWKLTKHFQAIMRLEHSDGQVVEWCIHHDQDIDDVIGDVLECDDNCRIFIVKPDQTIFVQAGPITGDDHVTA